MKFFIIFLSLFAFGLAAPPKKPEQTEILRHDTDFGIDSFRYAFATSDGTEAQAEGQLKNAGQEDASLVIRGVYTYIGDDGQTYTVTYLADENGFQPQGDHLPLS
uniref:Cuticle protein n=1 Tax=Glossina morsitans morsitans TaxID=37546 RepID=A0A1B0G043_GLOMM